MKSIDIPWGAWHGDVLKSLTFPDHADIQIMELAERPIIDTGEISRKLENLAALINLKKPQRVVIVVDDLTRPLKMAPVIRILLDILQSAGCEHSCITFVIGGGGHRALCKEEIAKKVGESVVKTYPIINHSPYENLKETSIAWKGTPVLLNKTFMEADFRIILSGLVPHSFAGFSGGAKMLFPGIANLEIIKRTHKSVMMGFMGKLGEVDGNRFRQEIEQMALEIGVDYFIGLIGNSRREAAGMFSGDLVETHRAAARYAQQYYSVPAAEERFDAVVLNAYPKDTELLQAENAFIPLRSTAKKLVRENGTVIVTSACSEGLGHHALFGPGGTLYRKAQPKRFLEGKQFIFFSENIRRKDFEQVFWDGYHFFSSWERVEENFPKSSGKPFRVLVFPRASLQLVSG
jgi:nickel-dependent lactate racemase